MKVSVVIPAFNEEKTIGKVLDVLVTCEQIDEIIVVSDGSTDKTAEIAHQYSISVIDLDENCGKGGALKVGVDNAQGEVIVFLDADLIGLTVSHLNDLLKPVLNDEADMSIGIFGNGRLTTDLAQVLAPYLSGQRVLKRSLLDGLDNMEMTRFGIEIALTQYARANNFRCKEVKLVNMSHIMKEEKLGLVRGFLYRLKMYWEILQILGQRHSSLK